MEHDNRQRPAIPTISPDDYEGLNFSEREHQWDDYTDEDEDYESQVDEHEYTTPGDQAHTIKSDYL
ncbi:hypothetical protein BJX62DRAFT_203207 [Aspergillus germanicus]